jgi:hypothetical protein
MHTEKNIAESIVGTLLDIPGKSKDSLNVRLDLKEMKIRKNLWPIKDSHGKIIYNHDAPWTLNADERELFCRRLNDTKLPDGYASNISKCVDMSEYKLFGLKSHDYHVLMQNLLPMALRGLMHKPTRLVITRLCCFFGKLCQREVSRKDLDTLEKEIAITMCELELLFPPSFFDIMVHLTIHLVREVRLGGPVHFRWMYPFER